MRGIHLRHVRLSAQQASRSTRANQVAHQGLLAPRDTSCVLCDARRMVQRGRRRRPRPIEELANVNPSHSALEELCSYSSRINYLFLWLADGANVGTMQQAGSIVALGLDWRQASIAMYGFPAQGGIWLLIYIERSGTSSSPWPSRSTAPSALDITSRSPSLPERVWDSTSPTLRSCPV